MKNYFNLSFLLAIAAIITITPGKKTSLVSGDDSFLKEAVTIYIEFDLSKSSIDGLDSEEEFVEYKKGKEKNNKEAEKWEKGWNKDKESFTEFYGERINKECKKMPASFNIDDPASDYKMTVQPIHIETGNPMKASSVETKLIFTETSSGEEKAVIYVVQAYGSQMGPMTPTSGMRVQMALANSAGLFAKYYKKRIK